jgi:site-specific DNA-methyltransferase (adenine-specific)
MEWMANESVDSIVTDPPYGLNFMNKHWDYEVPSIDVWRECLRVLRPGGHLLSFFGTRTYHRGVVPIEDAGFEIRDQIGWTYGSGFPKSHNGPWGGTALKPAWEPIVMARKPVVGTVAQNFERYGVGGLNIDECRIGNEKIKTLAKGQNQSFAGDTSKDAWHKWNGCPQSEHFGRFPANLIHDGSDEVLAAFPDLGKAGRHVGRNRDGGVHNRIYGARKVENKDGGYADSGSAARFFYCAKANKKDREADNLHPTVKPTDLMRYLCRLVTPKNGLVFDPFMGSGSTGKAALLEGFRFIGIEREAEYINIATARLVRAEQEGEL